MKRELETIKAMAKQLVITDLIFVEPGKGSERF